MQRHQIKRKRVTLEDAHKYNKCGMYSNGIKHRTTDEEREAELNKVYDYLQNLVKIHFPRTTNLEYAILKSHLIVEYVLTEYIRCYSHVLVDPTKIRFSFSQKIEIAYLMGFGANLPTLLPTVEVINKIRNQVAHSFSLDRTAVDELIRINHDDYEAVEIKNDKQRIASLRNICIWICNFTAGLMMGTYAVVRLKP